MEALGGDRMYSSYSFTTSTLDGVSGQRHAPAMLYPWGRTPGTHCTVGWVGRRDGLDTEATGKILCPCQGSNLDRPVVQPVVRHYTAWATPTHGPLGGASYFYEGLIYFERSIGAYIFRHLAWMTYFTYHLVAVLGAGAAQAVQCLTTGWTTGRSGFDPRWGQRIFPLASVSRPALGPTQPPVQWVPGVLSPGVKARQGRDADHSPPCSAEVENK
jgi:hypothetical protein